MKKTAFTQVDQVGIQNQTPREVLLAVSPSFISFSDFLAFSERGWTNQAEQPSETSCGRLSGFGSFGAKQNPPQDTWNAGHPASGKTGLGAGWTAASWASQALRDAGLRLGWDVNMPMARWLDVMGFLGDSWGRVRPLKQVETRWIKDKPTGRSRCCSTCFFLSFVVWDQSPIPHSGCLNTDVVYGPEFTIVWPLDRFFHYCSYPLVN